AKRLADEQHEQRQRYQQQRGLEGVAHTPILDARLRVSMQGKSYRTHPATLQFRVTVYIANSFMTASVFSLMLLLGASAAAANFFGGAIVVHRHWERRYLRYFVALSAGFMLAVVLAEMLPESLRLNAARAPLFILAGYLVGGFFEQTVALHFHFVQETAGDDIVPAHRTYCVVVGMAVGGY